MKNFNYIIKRIFSMDIRGIFDVAEKVHKKTGLDKPWIVLDIVWCGIRHMAGYVDYLDFEMYNLNESERKTVMTRGRNNVYIRKLNDPKYQYLFDSKKDFNTTFNDYLERDWISISECCYDDFLKFLEGKKDFFAKPNSGTCGRGIEKIVVKDFDDPRTLWYYLEDRNLTLLEETIIQHPSLNQLHPLSINTVRFVTIYHEQKVHIVAAYLRIGNNRIVDNFNNGGMVVPVDLATGLISGIAIDKAGNQYEKHPITQVSIPGFQIPMWESCIEIVKSVAPTIPQVGLVGWDIGISINGPLIVEANEYPGHDIYQLPVHTPDKVGMYPTFKNILKVK
jgi:hypothetical protein